MTGKPRRSGGARLGTGPIRRRFILSRESAARLRVITRLWKEHRYVTEADLTSMIEMLVDERYACTAPAHKDAA